MGNFYAEGAQVADFESSLTPIEPDISHRVPSVLLGRASEHGLELRLRYAHNAVGGK